MGDTGESDGEAGEQMLRFYGESVKAVFLHVVSDHADQVHVEQPGDKIIKGRPLVHFRTYLGAAAKAYELGLLGKEGVNTVAECCFKDLQSMGIEEGDSRFMDVKRDWNRWLAIR